MPELHLEKLYTIQQEFAVNVEWEVGDVLVIDVSIHFSSLNS